MPQTPQVAAQPKAEVWHNRSAEEVLADLGSSTTGLTAQEAAKRLAADGPNELTEGKRIASFQIFLGQFKSLLIWILIVAGVISGVLGEGIDAIAILAIVVLNAVIGFYQEYNAEKSIAALKKMAAPHAKVLRDGRLASTPASRIVAGDIHALEAGDLLAAGIKAGGSAERVENAMPKVHEIPFDSDRKRSAVVRRKPDGKLRAHVNGAPGPLLERCTRLYTSDGIRPLTEEDRKKILAKATAMAQQALRVLGSAFCDMDEAPSDTLTADTVERDLVLVGLPGMYDPPRQEAKDAIAKCRAGGIRVVMITGDHPHR
jgi:magnesium-transporting ATPase (P-type)